ncbi:hypothetical protein SAMN04488029_2849 [Reichenbachiella faecimaris]|uniref:Uncharacterized protein n=1 Tax=Reichenbachiella faecimaris TaxID=692418 RepID=A0A1W2GI83_REIFA|nr:hypothetical protein [Reichenbachiella faecimaris]SMD36357.1 hypothetical protein SAMN04488029_2849 [Reichenbachiella faecimaris]
MNPILKNILALIAGIVIGSLVNIGLIMLGHALVPPPEGMNPMDLESLKEFMPMFETKHFIGPFLAHGLGTLAGAFATAKIAANHQLKFALAIGVWFLYGGISMVLDFPSPMWFNVLDLSMAYLPMAWMGWQISSS